MLKEKNILWSTVIETCRFHAGRGFDDVVPMSVVIDPRTDFDPRECRNWLHENKISYRITGLCNQHGHATAFRFHFTDVGDRILFILRWK